MTHALLICLQLLDFIVQDWNKTKEKLPIHKVKKKERIRAWYVIGKEKTAQSN